MYLKNQNSKTFPWFLRGPLLLALVLVPTIVKYALQLSSLTLLSLTIASAGLVLCCYDFIILIKDKIRRNLSESLNLIILDDVLRNIYDPQVGLVACIISMVVGNASMYSFGFTQEQRLRLFQSCLWTSDEDTYKIFMTPGGIQQLLPGSIQEWLDPMSSKIDSSLELVEGKEYSQADNENFDDRQVVVTSTDSSKIIERSIDILELKSSKEIKEDEDSDKKTGSITEESMSQESLSLHTPQLETFCNDPLQVMASILKENVQEALQSAITHVSPVLPSAAALLLLLISRKKSKMRVPFLSLVAGASYISYRWPHVLRKIESILSLKKISAKTHIKNSIAFFVMYYFFSANKKMKSKGLLNNNRLLRAIKTSK